MYSLLYVDDEPGLLEIGQAFLESTGDFSVTTALSAGAGLEHLARHDFDAIISDFQMPEMDGIEFLKKVRQSFGNVPFILFTGRGREEIVILAINNGVDFYLQKGGDPRVQFAELAHKVRQAVGRRRAETALSESEKRLADIIDFLPDATFAIDTKGVVIAWNRAMERMTGVGKNEMLGKGDCEYALPFYHERRPILINLVLKDDPALLAHYPVIRKEGKTLVSEITIPHFNEGRGAALWFTASPLYDRKGDLAGAIESIREITERKQAEEALNESERRFRELADLLPQGVYEAGTDGSLTYANRRAQEMFGYSAEDIGRGLNTMDMIAQEDRARAAGVYTGMVTGGVRNEGNVEYRALRKDGTTFPISIFSSPIFRDGRIEGIRGIIIDITGRRRSEDRIRESEQNYRLLFDSATEGILIAQGDRMVHVNPAMVSLLGYSTEVLTSRPFTEFIHPDDRQMVLSRHLRRMKGENPETGYMFRILPARGPEKWVWINSTRFTWSGEPASLNFLTDITERKMADERLESANREYTALLDQIQDVYYRTDTAGRLTKVSRSWATLFGYEDASDCIGRNIAEDFYANPSDRQAVLEEIYRNGKVTNYPVLLKKRDGTPVLIEASSHLYYDSAGNISGIEGTFRDITERTRSEEELRAAYQQIAANEEELRQQLDELTRNQAALRKSEEKFRDLIETSPDLIWELDAEGVFTYMSPLCAEIIGYTQREVVGRPIFDFISDDAIADIRKIFSGSVKAEKPPAAFDLRIRRRDGQVIITEIRAVSQSDSEGRFTGFRGTARDLTKKRMAEEALNESEKRFRELADLLPQGIYEADRNGRMTYGNRLALEMSGYTPQDVETGLDALAVIAPGDRKRAATIFRNLVETGERTGGEAEYTALRKDGSMFPVAIFSTPILRNGGITGVRGVIMDITDRKKAADELQAVNEQLVAAGEELKAQYEELARSETQIRMSETRLSFMLGFYEYAQKSRRELLEYAIEGAGIITGSPLGYLAFLNEDESELSMYAWSKTSMAACSMQEKTLIYQTAKTGLWGEAVRRRQPVVTNDYAAPDPAKKGYPAGHPHITRHMNVPVMDEGHVVLVAGVANKPADYTEHDISELRLLMQGLWTIIKRKQVEEEQKAAFEQLAAAGVELRAQYNALASSQEELQRHKVRLEEIASTVPGVVYQFYARPDGSRGLYYVSSRAREIFGIAPDPGGFFPLFTSCVHPDDRDSFLSSIDDAVNSGTEWKFEGRFLKPSGTIIWFEGISAPVLHGDELVFTGVMLDTTERKRTGEALRESEEKYRTLVESSFDGIAIHQDGILVYLNRTASRILGSDDPELFIGKPAMDIVVPALQEQLIERIGAAHENSQQLLHQQFQRLDGTGIDVDVTTAPGTWKGRPAAFVTFRDVSGQKKAEAAIRETNRKLNLLTGITRHDILNKVAVILGFMKIVENKFRDPALARYLEKMESAVIEIRSQIEFTRVYDSIGSHEPRWIDLYAVLPCSHIPESITLHAEVKDISIFADPMLEKVFSNLLDNSIRHGQRVTEIRVKVRGSGNDLVVVWEDNGIGIPAGEKERIFERGFGKHTGLGMFLVREILAITGITIRETGTCGEGAQFEMIVPAGMYRIAS